jgi:hypothetical protein
MIGTLLAVSMLPSAMQGQTEWRKYECNPVLEGTPGSWDESLGGHMPSCPVNLAISSGTWAFLPRGRSATPLLPTALTGKRIPLRLRSSGRESSASGMAEK